MVTGKKYKRMSRSTQGFFRLRFETDLHNVYNIFFPNPMLPPLAPDLIVGEIRLRVSLSAQW
jgi:hypothetical protein